MLVLIDNNKLDNAERDLNMSVEQLLTPLTRYRRNRPDAMFAIDNGAFAGFNEKAFMSLLNREYENRNKCRFVCCPDVVADCNKTLELFNEWRLKLSDWPLAFVAQDGQGVETVPWDHIAALFIGGSTRFKLSAQVEKLIKEAKQRGKWVHVGRVNGPERYKWFESLGADSCDGTGLARYSHMRQAIAKRDYQHTLFV